jgi:hypothetical protein
VNQFRGGSDRVEIVGERDTPTGRSLYIARPIKIGDGACLTCHSTVDAAPKTLVDRYGPANGFGWQLNDGCARSRANGAGSCAQALAYPGSVVAVFAVIGVMLNVMPGDGHATDLRCRRSLTGQSGRAEIRSTADVERRDRDAGSIDRPHANEHGPGHEDADTEAIDVTLALVCWSTVWPACQTAS